MGLSHLDNDNSLHALESSLATKGYPQEAKLLLDTIFGEFINCYVEIRLLDKGRSPIQLFYPSVATIQCDLIRNKNSEGYNCYFGVCLRKTQKGDKSSVASISALWGDIDAKNFSGGKPEALAQLQKLPPYLFPSVIVDTGHGYHLYWLLREVELIESPQDILRLEAYMKGLALTLNGDSTSDLSRVLRLPGLLNQKDAKNPCLCRIIHWEPERRFNPMDFDDYQEEIRKEAPEGKPKRAEEARRERSDEFNTLAIGMLVEHCKFIQHCSDDAETLPESRWWSMCQILSFLGKPGKEKAHELSKPYPKYTEAETNKKLEYARDAGDKDVGPHTCNFIQQDLQFDCAGDCLAKKWGLKSPVVLATRLASKLPEVVVNNRQLRDVTSEVLEILEKANQPEFLFVRAGALTRITWNEEGYPIIEVVNESALRGYMTRTANFIKVHESQKGETTAVAVPPPLDVVRDILSLGQWSLPPLQGIIQAPVIREDGTILSEPGYDAATKLYYMPTPELKMPEIPDSPTHEDALKAMAFLMELICDFPFDSEASKANALAVMITPILRPLIVGKVPMALFDKPQPGTGASLLAEAVDTIATGRSSAISPLKDDEAWRKEIGSILLRGQRTVIIDNVERKLYAASLGSLLTSDYWEFRVLGHNQEVALPHRCVWIATGNNIQVGGDLPRRCYWVRLDAKQARPWERDRKQFKHPELTKWVREERGRIIAAILTIGRAWFIAGQLGKKTLGSYEEWAGVIGGILGYVGVSGFLDNLSLMYDTTDVDTPQWEDFLAAWYTILGAVPVTAAEVVRALDDYDNFAVRLPDDLVDYHRDKSGKQAKGFTRRLGKALAKHNGVHFPRGYVLEKCGEKDRAICWKVDNLNVTKNEFNEFNDFSSPPRVENFKGRNNIYKGKETNSQNSAALRVPDKDVAPADPWEGMPDYPKEPCHACGGSDFWPDLKGKRFVCGRCHPKPPQIDMEV